MGGKGKVWLVGAGPSDPGLFTIKGKAVLEKANVVVYDKLVGQGLMSLIPKTAKKIYVGKAAGNHSASQEEINEILLREAFKGNNVVRLKGGDPFLFGRGGEELELLVDNDIEFEIVPGVTSAISVPAYAGIPVTHREVSSSLHIITGYTKSEGAEGIDFKSLASLNGTLVFLMGVGSLEKISTSLIKEGMDKNTPAAILESGTTSKQRRVVSTLELLPNRAKVEKIKTPGIIIVGKVAELSNRFSWEEKRPLSGMKIMVTRPSRASSKLAQKLYDKGAEVVEVPTIRTESIVDNMLLKLKLENIKDYKWIVLTSPAGVDAFFNFIVDNSIDIRSLYGIKFAGVGSATSGEIRKRGILVDFTPSKFNGETLARELLPMIDGKVLILRAKSGAKGLTDVFDENDVDYDDIPIYETYFEQPFIDNITDFDYVTFTSASTVEGFVKSFKDVDYAKIKGICIGESTEAEAKKYSFETYVSKEASLNSMVELLESLR